METLDIFTQKLGDLERGRFVIAKDDEQLGIVSDKLLDCVQTVVDVMTDAEGRGWQVRFTNTVSAYTDRSEARRIVISALPLTKSEPNTPLADIARIMTGLAVHEVGHTKRGSLGKAIATKWPGKQLPKRLGNIIEDVVLERLTERRYAGFRGIFRPTLEWVAKETCPDWPLAWTPTTGDRTNFVGQVVRYREFVRFADDAVTQRQLRWWDDWSAAIDADWTDARIIEHIELALTVIHDHSQDEPEPEGETPSDDGEPGDGGEGEDGDGQPGGDTEGEGKDDEPERPTVPENEDDEPIEDGEGNPADDGDDDDDDTEGDGSAADSPIDDDADSDTEGESSDDDADGEADADGDGEPESEDGDKVADGQIDEGGTLDRVDLDEGANDGGGAGGGGEGIAEAGVEDPDAGLDPNDLHDTQDDMTHRVTAADVAVQTSVETERRTTRLDAKEHGTMRVVFDS